jgi:alpha-glucosidase (family GH31 glycosyl hydrolase)
VSAKRHFIPVFIAVLLSAGVLQADSKFVLERDGRTVVLEPYAPNIIRVTLSRLKDPALAAPGQGFLATPSMEGWTSDKDEKADQLKSDRLVVTVPARSSNVKITTASGTQLVNLQSWSMNPVTVAGEHTYHLQATFASPEDEHYYGLGQNQEGFLDLRGHPMRCWHNYDAPGGESVCVPFLVTNRG